MSPSRRPQRFVGAHQAEHSEFDGLSDGDCGLTLRMKVVSPEPTHEEADMNKHIKPALRKMLARAFSVTLTLVAATMVPAMIAVIAPASAPVSLQGSRIVGPGRHFGTDYTANPLHLPRRPPRDEIE